MPPTSPWTPRFRLAGLLLPRLVLTWIVCASLYWGLTKFGQLTDLGRGLGDDYVRHMFTSMAVCSITGFCVALCLGGLPLDQVRKPGLAVAITVAFASAAPFVLAFVAFGLTREQSVSRVLGLTGVLLPAGLVVNIWRERAQVSAERSIALVRATLATYTVALYLWLFVDPVRAGSTMGPIATFFVALSTALWIGWFLFTRRRWTVALAMAVLGFLLLQGSFGVRELRTVAREASGPTVSEHARRWIEARRAEIARADRYPVLFVTSDGGGVRAAFWTATVLGALADDETAIVRHAYLLSGVSGGSVGVATFAAQVADREQVQSHGGYRVSSQALLSADLLAAPLAQLVTRDPFESVFCLGWIRLPWGCSAPGFDRAIALEQSLERAWHDTIGTRAFEKPVESLWPAPAMEVNVPALILNATDADSGDKRAVASYLDPQAVSSRRAVLALLAPGRTLSLSSAAFLSARFPLISPAAGVALDGSAEEQVVDGGYFDNSGASSASEALASFMDAARAAGLAEHIAPVALLITNDTARARPGPLPAGCTALSAERRPASHGLGGLMFQPVGTLDAERSRTAENHRRAWISAVEAGGGEALEIGLFTCREDQDFEIPLGWSLSDASRSQMQTKIERLKGSAGAYRRVIELVRLATRASPP